MTDPRLLESCANCGCIKGDAIHSLRGACRFRSKPAAVAPPGAPPAGQFATPTWQATSPETLDAMNAATDAAHRPPETTAPTATESEVLRLSRHLCGTIAATSEPMPEDVYEAWEMLHAEFARLRAVSPVASSATPTPSVTEAALFQRVEELTQEVERLTAENARLREAISSTVDYFALMRKTLRMTRAEASVAADLARALTTEPRDAMAHSIAAQIEGSNVDPR